MIYLEPHDKDWQDAWNVTEGLIKLMRDDIAQRKARFLLVGSPENTSTLAVRARVAERRIISRS